MSWVRSAASSSFLPLLTLAFISLEVSWARVRTDIPPQSHIYTSRTPKRSIDWLSPDVGMYVCPFLKICRSRGIYIAAPAPRDSSETASDNWKCRCSTANTRTAAPIVDYFDCYSHGNWYCCHCDYCYDLRLWGLYRRCRRHHRHRRSRLRHRQHSAINNNKKITKLSANVLMETKNRIDISECVVHMRMRVCIKNVDKIRVEPDHENA